MCLEWNSSFIGSTSVSSCVSTLSRTYKEGRCCSHWAKTEALWCAECRRGPEPGEGLWRGPGLIFRSQGHRRGHRGGADQQRKRTRRNVREVAAASSAAPGTADAGAAEFAGSAAECWWLYVQTEGEKTDNKTKHTNVKKRQKNYKNVRRNVSCNLPFLILFFLNRGQHGHITNKRYSSFMLYLRFIWDHCRSFLYYCIFKVIQWIIRIN